MSWICICATHAVPSAHLNVIVSPCSVSKLKKLSPDPGSSWSLETPLMWQRGTVRRAKLPPCFLVLLLYKRKASELKTPYFRFQVGPIGSRRWSTFLSNNPSQISLICSAPISTKLVSLRSMLFLFDWTQQGRMRAENVDSVAAFFCEGERGSLSSPNLLLYTMQMFPLCGEQSSALCAVVLWGFNACSYWLIYHPSIINLSIL